MATETSVILVGNVGAGWFPPITDHAIDPSGWGSRKIAAIRAHRQWTGCDYAEAKAAIERIPEFAGTHAERKAAGLG